MSPPRMKGIDYGKGQIDLRHHRYSSRFRPTEIHHKVDGSVEDGPSFVIVMELAGIAVYGEVSLKMFNEALGDIGYKIRRTNVSNDGRG